MQINKHETDLHTTQCTHKSRSKVYLPESRVYSLRERVACVGGWGGVIECCVGRTEGSGEVLRPRKLWRREPGTELGHLGE